MTLNEFVIKYDGQPVDVDQAYGNQCWDLVALYCQDVIGIPASSDYGLPTGPDLDARDIWVYFENPLPQYFDKITYIPGLSGQPGDIVVWNIGNSGHVDIWLRGDANAWVGFDQNWPIGSVSHGVNHNHNGVLGFLRPHKTEVNMPSLVTELEVKHLAQAYFTDSQVQAMGGLDKVVQDNLGAESNSLIDAWADSPQFLEKRQYYEGLQAALDTANQNLKNAALPAVQPVLDQATKDQITNTNSIVQWLKDFLSKLKP